MAWWAPRIETGGSAIGLSVTGACVAAVGDGRRVRFLAGNCDGCVDAGIHVGGMQMAGVRRMRGVSRVWRSMTRGGMMRCRPGIVTETVFGKVPGLQRTASRCAAPGTRADTLAPRAGHHG